MGEVKSGNGPTLIGLTLWGTLARLIYGLLTREWNTAADHLAWQLALSEPGPWHFDQLFHYPHEGAGPLLSLLAIGFNQISLPGLAAAALVIDTIGRFVHLSVAQHLFGRTTAVWFGVWTVFAVPGLYPWSVVNYGIHALSSFWPFVLLIFLTKDHSRLGTWAAAGACLGLAISWSLDSLVLLPMALLAGILLCLKNPTKGLKSVLLLLMTGLVVAAPYLAVRASFDTGFHLEPHGWFWIRGVAHELPALADWWRQFRITVTHTVPGATQLTGWGCVGLDSLRLWWAVTIYCGILLGARQCSKVVWFAPLVILLFLIAYSGSPYWFDRRDHDLHYSYGLFRHVYYILPLMVVVGIHGLVSLGRKSIPVLAVLVLIGSASTFSTVAHHERHQPDFQPAGWVLGRKLGHDPARLERFLIILDSEDAIDLSRGFGWGIAETVLASPNCAPGASEAYRVSDLLELTKGFRESRSAVVEGIVYFLDIDQKLPTATKKLIREQLEKIQLQ